MSYFGFDKPALFPLDIAAMLEGFTAGKENTLGTELRISAERAGTLFDNDRLRFTDNGKLEAVGGMTNPVRGLAISDTADVAMARVIGFLGERAKDTAGNGAVPAVGTPVFLAQYPGNGAVSGTFGVPFAYTGSDRTVSAPGGYVMDDAGVLVDSAAPALEHLSLEAYAPTTDITQGGAVNTRVWDDTDKKFYVQVASAGSATVNVTWKFPVVPKIENLNNGGVLSVFTQVIKTAGTVLATPRVIDSENTILASAVTPIGTSLAPIGLSWAFLNTEALTVGRFFHFQFALSLSAASTVRFETTAQVRYRPRRRFT